MRDPMPKVRLLLTLLLIFVIPVQGMTAVVLLKQPCPMEHQDMESSTKGPCCQDDDSIANQPDCKPGQECHISQMSVNGAPLTATHDSPDAAPIPLVKADIPPRLLSSIWRPPLPPLQ